MMVWVLRFPEAFPYDIVIELCVCVCERERERERERCCGLVRAAYVKPASPHIANKHIRPVSEYREGSMDIELSISLCRDVLENKAEKRTSAYLEI